MSEDPGHVGMRLNGVPTEPDAATSSNPRSTCPSMKDPLRNAVLDAGWTWRGVVFKL